MSLKKKESNMSNLYKDLDIIIKSIEKVKKK